MGSISLVQDFKNNRTYPYKVTKAALNMLNAQYALEFGEAGFTFLCVSPGVSFFLYGMAAFSFD